MGSFENKVPCSRTADLVGRLCKNYAAILTNVKEFSGNIRLKMQCRCTVGVF